jgi:formylmethanofuran dehydrogenase subunit E
MRNRLAPGVVLIAVLLALAACASQSPVYERPLDRASADALADALRQLDVPRGDERLLVLTNAGYARTSDGGTDSFADVATGVTGCSVGKRSLLFLHSPSTAGLWFAVFRRDTRATVFATWKDGAFESQTLVADPGLLDRPDHWREANSGPVRGTLFPIVSVSHAWAQGADPRLLKCAEFHNHCCGGVTAGYLTARYVQEHFPLRPGERYVFVTGSPSCAMDAIQVMFDATTGKHGVFATAVDEDSLEAYVVDDAKPLTLVMRVNRREDACDGLFLGFAWYDTGQGTKLWNVAEVERADCVRVLKRFSGDADLVASLTAPGTDPYARVWAGDLQGE